MARSTTRQSVWMAWATEYPDDGVIYLDACDIEEATIKAEKTMGAHDQPGEPMPVSVRRVRAADCDGLLEDIEVLRAALAVRKRGAP